MVEVGLIVALALAIAASIMILRRNTERGGSPGEYTNLPDVELDLKLQEEVRNLAHHGHTEEAIKHLRKQARLTPHEATVVVQTLMVGKTFPDPSTPQQSTESGPNAVVDDDLLNRLHLLVAQDPHKRNAAIQLLRDRTGMNAKDARRFVNAL
ncbi:hypothetical protein [Phytoactinopolyspora limicola]|uniref:hypothetical protein n=1 Tax=Phytoactinopolyspora limicola TaxID=2715536 RepID=UPI001407AE50|nr:hypothetical protein [Phytoactinopolyspora limicola]